MKNKYCLSAAEYLSYTIREETIKDFKKNNKNWKKYIKLLKNKT